ncbi:helix-turn-helix transcriptional regulator [Psychroserpens damuponensis]|uniref:helix-turn-helix transcriptional regulator n=1 Tax=Psychroserpens damuponensis TaxID=943936 RepID=UPI0006932FCF|nr:AraC family transcriptional regulator [Psychroserpens damuponensis]
MIKLHVLNSNLLESFENISNTIGEKHTVENGFGYTNLRHELGNGTVSMLMISQDISVLIFDINVTEDLEIMFQQNQSSTIDFIFCLEGHIHHKFSSNSKLTPINFRQNTIVKRSAKMKSILKFSKNIPLRVSIISYCPELANLSTGDFTVARSKAINEFAKVYAVNDYLYAGRVCFRTSSYVHNMMTYYNQNLTHLLFKEAAALNTIASQIERYTQDIITNHKDAPIRLYEIDKIRALETFIDDNLTENLTLKRLELISGLNATKLQVGFKYLFDKTVSTYITEKRLERAAKLIFESELNVSELVYSVGFSSRSYFSKIFKNYFGVLPSQCKTNPQLLAYKS